MKPEFLSTAELMRRWGTEQERSILHAIENGLPVYEETPDVGLIGLEELAPADVVERYNFNGKDICKPINFLRLIFKIEDVERFETENDESPLDDNVTKAQHKKLKNDYQKLKGRFEIALDVATTLSFSIAIRYELTGAKITNKQFVEWGEEWFPDAPKQIFKDLWKMVPKRYKDIPETDEKDV